MKKFKAAIFDMDGTLLESMYIWRNLSAEYIRTNHIDAPPEVANALTIGGIDVAVDFLLEKLDLKLSREELREGIWEVMADFYRTQAVLKPGVVNLLKKLQELNVRTMVLSATPQKLLHLPLSRLGIEEYFSGGLVSCYDTQYNKFHPEVFYEAAAHLGVEPGEAMIFEDAFYAARTVKKANMALTIISDMSDLHPEENRALADFYVEKSWDEFPVEQYF